MADLKGLRNFNADDEEPMRKYDPIPAGKYIVAITESGWKQTKSGQGQYLELVLQILKGEHKGRNLWVRLNLENPSEQAVKIARSELAAICLAVGKPRPADSTELHDLPFQAEVALGKRKDTGEPENTIRGYDKKPSAIAGATPAVSNDAPWNRGPQ